MKKSYRITKGCWVTIGATRSLLVNGQNGQFMLIPNEIANILESNIFYKEDFGEDYEFFDYFLTEGYIFSTVNSNHFKPSSDDFDVDLKEQKLIIDVDSFSNIDALCERLEKSKIKFENIQIRVFEKKSDLFKLLKEVNNISIYGFELVVNFDINPENYFNKFSKLYYIQIFNQKETHFKKNGLRVIEYLNEKIINESSCGNICNRNFVFNTHFKIKSSQGNTCLKNKFSIDRKGEYKNCPSMKNSFGNIYNSSLNDAISKFNISIEDKKLINITKNEIHECQICEFRDVCMDCRAYRQTENVYSKPKKCDYNPIKGVWKLVLIFIIFSFNSFSQYKYHILDSADFSPIPFSKIICNEKSIVFYSNENGIFEINDQLKTGDTLKIISYGYEIKNFLISDFEIDTFFLFSNEKTTLIDEVIVRPTKWENLILNEFEKPEFGNLSLLKGGVIASYIHNSKFTRGRLEKIDVYIKSLDTNYNLKLNLFNYDIVRNCPSDEIQISDVFVNFTGVSGWYSIKIKDTLYMPKDGICVGFEAIPKSNVFILEKNQCGKTSVIFSSYYEKNENGNRTSFTSLQSNKWYTPQANESKAENVLNLAVKLFVNGNIDLPTNYIPKFISNRKLKRKLNAKTQSINYNHSSIEDLFKSIIKCIEKNNLITISNLIVVSKENKSQFYEFVEKNQENWLTDLEKEKALSEWNYFLQNLDIAKINYLSEDYIEIVFPNKSNLFLFRDFTGWKVSPYYKKIVH